MCRATTPQKMTPPPTSGSKVGRMVACAAASSFFAGIQPASAAVEVYRKLDEDTFHLHYVPKKDEVVQKPLLCDPASCRASGGRPTSAEAALSLHPGEDHTTIRTSFLASRGVSNKGFCCEGVLRALLGRLSVRGPHMELQTYRNVGAAPSGPSIKTPIDGENGLFAFVTPEPFLAAGRGEEIGTEAHLKTAASLYFPGGDREAKALRDASITRHTVDLGSKSQKKKFVMHWWAGKSDQNLRSNRAGNNYLTRFVYRPTPEHGHGVMGGFTWIGQHRSADRFRVVAAESDNAERAVTEKGDELQSLDQMRAECEAGTGLHRLDETALQTQTAVMQQAVTQNFQKADGTALKPEDVELTLWWSERRDVDGLWIVGTLKELKEALEDSFREEQEYVTALQMDPDPDATPVTVQHTSGVPATTTISFHQAKRDEKFHVSRPYAPETDSTKHVLYLAGTGEHKTLTMMPHEEFAAERTLLNKDEPALTPEERFSKKNVIEGEGVEGVS